MDPEQIRQQVLSQNISLTPEALDTLLNASVAVNRVGTITAGACEIFFTIKPLGTYNFDDTGRLLYSDSGHTNHLTHTLHIVGTQFKLVFFKHAEREGKDAYSLDPNEVGVG